MVKVLNVITDTNIGGAGKVLLNYMKYRNKDDFDVSVALPRGSMLIAPLKALDTEIYELDDMADKSYDKAATGHIKELINRVQPDIVHTHGSLSGRIAAKACGRKIIYTRHCAFPVKSYMKRGPGRWFNKLMNEHYADRIIAVGEAARENLIESGISPKYIDMMMNGAEPVEKKSAQGRRDLRKRYGFSDDDFVIGILARIEKYKGHDDVLDALRILLAEGLNAKLIIAGSGTYEEEFRQRSADLAESGQVVFAGFIEDVSEILAVMDVQVNASYESETSSLSVIEGMSIGLPACVSDCGGNPLLIEDNVNGMIFPMRDSKKLAENIKTLMTDAGFYEKLSEGAAKIFQEKFTGEIFAANIEAVYIKIMKGVNNG